MSLHDALKELNTYPFHMPGHKRNPKFGIAGSEIDITEIEGFDNLHAAHGVLKELEDRLAKIYKAKRSFLSVGGSTLGLLCSLLAMTERGDTVIIARNCHKSVYNACILNGLKVVCLEPEFDPVSGCYTCVMQDRADAAVKAHPEAKVMVITTPTYEGRTSHITSKIPLLIDAAHGAHFGLGNFPAYPKGEIVVSSLHKTLPALTQTAVINVYEPALIPKVKRMLDLLETSSPSYVLMNSVSICCDMIEKRTDWFKAWYYMLSDFREIQLSTLRLLYSDDISKLVISTESTELSGPELAKLLRTNYGIEAEMSSRSYILLMTSVGDEKEAYQRLEKALTEIDETLSLAPAKMIRKPPIPRGVTAIAYPKESEETVLSEAAGKISAEFIYAYPPDIPIIAPGEVISEEALGWLLTLYRDGVTIVSDSGLFPNSILTKAEESTIIFENK